MDLMILMKSNGHGFRQFAWTLMSVKLEQIWSVLTMIMGEYVRLTRIVLILKVPMNAIVQKDRDS